VRLIPSLEKNKITTADLLTLDYVEVAKRAHLPLLDVRRLCSAVIVALQSDLGIREVQDGATVVKPTLKRVGKEILACSTVSTLDDDLDRALDGGVPTGYITEITGERYDSLYYF
jgi:DNA repair protein RAD57